MMQKSKSLILTGLFVILSLSSAVAADGINTIDQVRTPGADLNRILSDFQKIRMERELKKSAIDDSVAEKKEKIDTAPEAAVPETRLNLKKVEFTSSSVLSSDALKKFAASYEGREIGMAELKEFIGSINLWYRNNGYITARALLPPQEIRDGVLKVLLIEGLIGNVKIAGNMNTRDGYIRNRVSVPEGKLLDINRLDKKLAWFNGLNDVKIRIKLQAGEKPGTTDCLMLVYEPEDKLSSLFIDTAGNKGTGETRFGISYTDNSISGRRDAFSMTALMTTSSKAAMAAYNFPVNRYGTKASVYYNMNNLEIDNDGVGIRGKSNLAGFSLNHPLTVRPRFRSEITFDVQQQESENRISGVNFVDDNEERISFGYSLLKRSSTQAIYLKPTITLCDYNGIGDARKVRKYLFDGVWQKIRRGNQQIDLKISGQKTTDNYMPSSDQFFLGGLYSVRGYDESMISGDSGLNLKLDYSLPLKFIDRTRGFVFCDWGRIYGKSFSATRVIYSSGFGFIHSFARDSMIVLSVGYPMVKHINAVDVDPHKIELTMNISF